MGAVESHRLIRALSALAVLALVVPRSSAADAGLVADLGDGLIRTAESYFLDRGNNAVAGGLLYFFNDDGIHGYELWRTEGTDPGTRMVVDLCPGACGSTTLQDSRRIVALGEALVFAATDGVHGVELWTSDGSAGGTRSLLDILPGFESSFPAELTLVGTSVYFTADDGLHGRELWITDGSSGGTRMVADLSSAPSSTALGSALDFGGTLVFAGFAQGSTGVWRSDGTALGTFRIAQLDIAVLGWYGSSALATLSGALVFLAVDETGNVELWRSDGTETGTNRVSDEVEGYRFESGSEQVFILGDSELWRTDGTAIGTWRVPLPDDARPFAFGNRSIAIGDRLYFSGFDSEHGLEPWTSDGIVAGRLADIRNGAEPSLQAEPYWFFNTPFFARAGGKAIFFADDGVHGLEPWSSDGTSAGTDLLVDFTPGAAPSQLDDFQAARPRLERGDELFFVLRSGADRRLVRTDASEPGTYVVATLDAQSSAHFLRNRTAQWYQNPWLGDCFAPLGSGLLFSPTTSALGQELWFSTGTSSGTHLVDDLYLGDSSGRPFACMSWGGRGLFRAGSFPEHYEPLLSTDGTSGASELLADEVGYLSHDSFAPVGDSLYVATYDRILKTDGSAAGTEVLAPIGGNEAEGLGGELLIAAEQLRISDGLTGEFTSLTAPDAPSWSVRLAPVGDRVFLFGWTEARGFEPWVTDGTTTGTRLVREIGPGARSAARDFDFYSDGPLRVNFAAFDSTVIFFADDGIHGEELWTSDGTFEETRMVSDIINGPYPSSPRELVRFGAHVYFVAESHGKGRELWRSDGTEAGTELVVDLVKGPRSSLPENLHAAGSELYFSAWTPERGREAWRIRLDGSRNPQPVPLDEIAPGALSSSPQIFREIGGTVFTVANDNVHGFELWTLREEDVVFADGFEGTTTALWGPLPD